MNNSTAHSTWERRLAADPRIMPAAICRHPCLLADTYLSIIRTPYIPVSCALRGTNVVFHSQSFSTRILHLPQDFFLQHILLYGTRLTISAYLMIEAGYAPGCGHASHNRLPYIAAPHNVACECDNPLHMKLSMITRKQRQCMRWRGASFRIPCDGLPAQVVRCLDLIHAMGR